MPGRYRAARRATVSVTDPVTVHPLWGSIFLIAVSACTYGTVVLTELLAPSSFAAEA